MIRKILLSVFLVTIAASAASMMGLEALGKPTEGASAITLGRGYAGGAKVGSGISSLHARRRDGRCLRPCGVPPLLPDRPRTGLTHFLNFLKGCACKLAKRSLSCYVDGSSLFHTSLKKSAKL